MMFLPPRLGVQQAGEKEMPTYYAICNVNGPISVRLDSSTMEDALREFAAANTREWIDEARTDAEDDLGIDGSEMSDAEFDAALRVANAAPVKDLDEVVNAHAGTVQHLHGGWYLWEVREPEIKVLGIGSEFDLPDDAAYDTEMEWYGTVRVSIDGVVYRVGAVVGVRESERDTCRAAGAGVRPHLTAWYADSSDWDSAPIEGTRDHCGVPQALASTVIAEIGGSADKLWSAVR
jgi:hypothetical protein